ncbi:MAG: type I-E CRISPR-associated protein Cse2/CasB [Acidobacteriota bacterium]|nr:type I-E CRISPR-associated protein Cse2/CasB [Acidobacteriota bacterium]
MNEIIETSENVSISETATVSAEPEKEDRVIKYLRSLNMPPQNRAALANLRRGLGKPPKTAMEMFPYLGQFLSHKTKANYENTVFIAAALFAYYPDAKHAKGNLGASLRELKENSDSIEKRFVALLNAEAEDLPYYLRQIIGLLKANEIAVNWERLFKDILNWNGDKRYVQQKWAEQFWGNYINKTDDNQNSQINKGETN